jgi:hypothetical protein
MSVVPGDSQPFPADFALAFRAFIERAISQTPGAEPYFASRLNAHFATSALELPTVSDELPLYEHPNLQLAIDGYLSDDDRTAELLGVVSERASMMGLRLGDLASPARTGLGGEVARHGPVEYVNVQAGPDDVLPCVRCGLYLVDDAGTPLAVFLRPEDIRMGRGAITVEVMASTRAAAEDFLADLRGRMHRGDVYRGQVLAVDVRNPYGTVVVKFRRLAPTDRSDIVLPEGVLERVERHSVHFSAARDRLLASGQHLKRGLLLHGPPGTGKTLTAMYLAGQMPDRTVLVLTGRGLGVIETSCELARALAPATLILEDVDLVAEERTYQSTNTNAILFQLLNEMDGLADDADIMFILTTNRPELLEAALASRPGRVDEAIEIPLPDAACRARLFDVYARGLVFDGVNRDFLVEQTEGVAAAFIKELCRKAALLAATADGKDAHAGAITVSDAHFAHAMDDLLVSGGALTKALLGVSGRRDARPDECG